MKARFAFILMLFLVCLDHAEESYLATAKIWETMERKNWDAAIAQANRVIRVWGPQARRTNNQLKGYATAKDAKKYGNLNAAGVSLLLKGDALSKKGDKAAAKVTYQLLLDQYTYAQVWDPKGWFWKPAEEARKKLVLLHKETAPNLKVAKPHFPAARLKLPGKKGICFSMRAAGEPGSAKVNLPRLKKVNPYWSYSWGWDQVAGQPSPVEFVPMAWGAWSAADLGKSLQDKVVPHIKSGKVKRFLGFNEPDKKEQANMPYKAALKYWPILESLNVPLCSPGCANPEGLNDGTVQGVNSSWMVDFMREADRLGYRVDYVGVHWYGGTNAADFKAKMRRIYEKYGRRPLLITEFAPADWQAKTHSQNRMKAPYVLAFMKEVLPWLEKQDWVAGYAWFSFEHNEPFGHTSSLFGKNGDLTTLGHYYQSVTTQSPDGDQSIGE